METMNGRIIYLFVCEALRQSRGLKPSRIIKIRELEIDGNNPEGQILDTHSLECSLDYTRV